MIRLALAAAAAAIGALAACAAPEPRPVYAPSDVTVYENARVWTGEGFEPRRLAVAGSAFIDPALAPETAECVDLEGGWLTPALANAHQHTPRPTVESSKRFTDAGVFYVWNPNVLGSLMTEDFKAFFARSGTIDVRASAGGVTRPGSHPEPLYVQILGPRVYGGAGYEEMYLDAFHYARDAEEIEATLDRLEADGADFVKAYLLGSEGYLPPGPDGEEQSTTGLDPAMVPALVEAAHARGLPVGFHVETRADFRVIAEAGADFAMHLPAYGLVFGEEGREARRLTEADAQAAAASGLMAIPTYTIAALRLEAAINDPEREVDPDAADALQALQAHNIAVLHDAGVPILTGTDASEGSVPTELEYWVEIGAMSDGEAAQAAFATAARLFPERRLGCFEPGCEADFIVLGADPSDDISAVRDITLRVKAGEPIPAE